jgi:hypothetical protein
MTEEVLLFALSVHNTGASVEITTSDGFPLRLTLETALSIIEVMPSNMKPLMLYALEEVIVYTAHDEIENTVLNITAEFVRRFCELQKIPSVSLN